MAYKINDTCIACGACESECPNAAIASGDPYYLIDAAKCDDCATCVAACPVNAIEKA